MLTLLRGRPDPVGDDAGADRLSTILVVDDDAPTRFVLRMLFESAGHRVVEAAHGAAALEIISPHLLPDLVVTDLTMPILSGSELIERLRSAPATASIPIVVVSGNADSARALQPSGLVEAVVDKPFDAVALTKCIQAIASSGMGSRLTA